MIYLFFAMYCEAAPLIRQYRLKKNLRQTRFQVFENEEEGMRLVITGTGMIAAASALSCVCAQCGVNENDFCLNVGICAGRAETGQAFLCNKITDGVTGRAFYPDILYRHPFAEARAVTGGRPFREDEVGGGEEFCLYDMEAAALYQAGSYFFGAGQMSFIKIVSDAGMSPRFASAANEGTPPRFASAANAGNGRGVDAKRAEALVSAQMERVGEYIARLRMASAETPPRVASAANEETPPRVASAANAEDPEVAELCRDLRCTRAMSVSLAQHIRYCRLAGVNYEAVIRQMREEGLLPCKDKREGKICFEEFKRRLL